MKACSRWPRLSFADLSFARRDLLHRELLLQVAGRRVEQHTVVDAAINLPGATNVTAPNFWPDANLRARLGLSAAADPTYVQDAPRPFATRVLEPGARLVGALQSSP